jgi:carboxypeptidase C (cathepsin A)
VAYWTNGGPGASGISDGLLTEMGQVHVDDRSKTNTSAELEVLYNPLSWSKKANMLFVSQPKGVGFSYCVDELGNPVNEPEKRCINTDLSAAQDAYECVRSRLHQLGSSIHCTTYAYSQPRFFRSFFTAFFDAYPEFKKNDFFLTAESYGGTCE